MRYQVCITTDPVPTTAFLPYRLRRASGLDGSNLNQLQHESWVEHNPGQEVSSPVKSAAQVRVWQKGQENWLLTKIEKSLGGDFRRFPEGQEDPGLSGVRQKDQRTLIWVGSGQVDTAKWEVRMVLRRTPRFQEGTDSSDFRKPETLCRWREQRLVRKTPSESVQGRPTGQDGVRVVKLRAVNRWQGA